MLVPISQIQVATPNRYDLGNIKSLADNIAEFGMLHPIIVNEKYELIAGYRRLKAAELLGWSEVPVSIISPTDDLKQFDTSLHENFRRKDLNPLEICDLILERKYRWEKIHGPIKTGPKSGDNPAEVEFYGNSVKFNLETSRILRMGESSINRFLQLKELDPDLRQQVEERKISYRDAIDQQSSRKKEQKLAKSKKVGSSILPDKETALALQAEYNQGPILFQIMMLVGHIYQSMNRFQGKQPEFESANPDRLVMMVGHIAAISSWLNDLMKQSQETLMKNTGTQIIAEK
jgi:ParB family transcriptional regulator, chromosome partitioning protein